MNTAKILRAGGAAPTAALFAALAVFGPLPVFGAESPEAGVRGGRRFDFGGGTVAQGFVGVGPDSVYEVERGWGFEPGAVLRSVKLPGSNALTNDAVGGEEPFLFSVDLPEGNHRVTVHLCGARGSVANVTVKAELRRLMLERIEVPADGVVSRTFTVNVRQPKIVAANGVEAGAVRLKSPRETADEAWAWDKRLTLEFSGINPAVCGIEIEPAPEISRTLHLLGDSTVCDQAKEPYASWGQMLPRFLAADIAVANHGESGETYRDALARRRLDKVLSVLRPGDLVLMQFGHNDQKQLKAGSGGPNTTYVDEMRRCIDAVRGHGGVPVVVTSVERRAFDAAGKVVESLKDYVAAAKRTAAERKVPCLDLNASSRALYATLGEEGSKAAFALQAGKLDNTHHNAYGAYLLAQAVVQLAREQKILPAEWVAADYRGFDPRKPLPFGEFKVPPSTAVTKVRPLGD